jgi:hypothetical protein
MACGPQMVGRTAPAGRRDGPSSGILPGNDCLGAGRRPPDDDEARERELFVQRMMRWAWVLGALAIGAALLGLT